jgi:hypothetical protein
VVFNCDSYCRIIGISLGIKSYTDYFSYAPPEVLYNIYSFENHCFKTNAYSVWLVVILQPVFNVKVNELIMHTFSLEIILWSELKSNTAVYVGDCISLQQYAVRSHTCIKLQATPSRVTFRWLWLQVAALLRGVRI